MSITIEQAKNSAEAINAALTTNSISSAPPTPWANPLDSAGNKASIANFLASELGDAGVKIVGPATSSI